MSFKIFLTVFIMCLSSLAFSQMEDESADVEDKTLVDDNANAPVSKGTKSHNGKKQEMSPEEIQQRKAARKAIQEARNNLKKDGKLSKEDRKQLRKLKKEARKKFNGGGSNETPAPGKDTRQMIDDADAEPETEQEPGDPQE